MSVASSAWSARRNIGLAIVISAVLALPSAADGRHSQPLGQTGELEVITPESVTAGEPYVIEVWSEADTTATVAIDAGYGPLVLDQPVVDGLARFEVPGAVTAGSGIARIDSRVGSERDTTTIEVMPGEPVDPLPLFLGPRTVVADGSDHSMIVAVPVDQLGNPVAEGTEVLFLIRRPAAGAATETATTSGLLAFLQVVGGTTSGRTTVSGSVDDVAGPGQSFLQVAGLAAPFQLLADDLLPAADGATLFEVETTLLVDRLGNELPDGTLVSLDINGVVGGKRRLWSSTIDGTAIFVVEAPPLPGEVELIAAASRGTSDPLTIRFEPAVSEVNVGVTQDLEGEQWIIEIGPVIAESGGYVTDGTTAEAIVDGVALPVPLENGEARLAVQYKPTTLEVLVLGVAAASIVGFTP